MNRTEWIFQGTGWLVLDGAVWIPSPRVEKFGSGVSSKPDHVHGVGPRRPFSRSCMYFGLRFVAMFPRQ